MTCPEIGIGKTPPPGEQSKGNIRPTFGAYGFDQNQDPIGSQQRAGITAWGYSSGRGSTELSTGCCSMCRSSPRSTGRCAIWSIHWGPSSAAVPTLNASCSCRSRIRHSFSCVRHQLIARRHYGPDHSDGLRADRSDVTGQVHAFRPRRVGDQHCLDRQRHASGDPVRRNHLARRPSISLKD